MPDNKNLDLTPRSVKIFAKIDACEECDLDKSRPMVVKTCSDGASALFRMCARWRDMFSLSGHAVNIERT